MSERRRRRRPLTEDERQIWDRVAKTVAPLEQAVRLAHPVWTADMPESDPADPEPFIPLADPPRRNPKPAAGVVQSVGAEALQALHHRGVGAASPAGHGVPSGKGAKSGLPRLEHGASPGVDRRTADRFRKGRMGVERRIDLHGMTQDQAHSALTRFIETSSFEGLRCVLVITGKGMRGEGVLRRMVPRWLNDTRLRQRILSFSHAQIPDGGDGALYVLLKRQRDPRD